MPQGLKGKMFQKINMCHLEITRRCNLRCKYCYATLGANAAPLMTEEMALACASQVISGTWQEEITFCFHGGEALLASPEWFEAVCAGVAGLARVAKKRVRFLIQTNATLLDMQYVQVFLKYRVIVGVSLDGPPAINDISRGLSDKTLEGIRCLKEAGIYPGVLMVLSRINLDRLDDVLDFFAALGLRRIQTNTIWRMGRALENDVALDAAELVEARRILIARILRDSPCPVDVDTLEMLGRYLNPRSEADLRTLGCCQPFCHAGISLVRFDAHGRVFPCGPSAHMEEYLLGTVGCLNRAKYKGVLGRFHRKDDRYRRECPRCTASCICSFGCPAEGGMHVETCKANKILFGYLEKIDRKRLSDAYRLAGSVR